MHVYIHPTSPPHSLTRRPIPLTTLLLISYLFSCHHTYVYVVYACMAVRDFFKGSTKVSNLPAHLHASEIWSSRLRLPFSFTLRSFLSFKWARIIGMCHGDHEIPSFVVFVWVLGHLVWSIEVRNFGKCSLCRIRYTGPSWDDYWSKAMVLCFWFQKAWNIWAFER